MTLAMKSRVMVDEDKQPPWAHLRLPPFPGVALRVIQLTNDENVQLHQLSEQISADPAFASEVLAIANSAAYALRYPVCSIVQAVAVLGANHLQGICLTVAVRAYLGKALNHPLIRNLWRHNLACAAIAEQVAASGFMNKDAAYTAGILHDIGRLALSVIRPTDYAALLGKHEGSGVSILQLESDLFGLDHCEAGRYLVAKWGMPSDFDSIVFDHHSPRSAKSAWSMAELIKISCRLADRAGFPAFPGCSNVPFALLREEIPIRERQSFHTELESLVSCVTERIEALSSV